MIKEIKYFFYVITTIGFIIFVGNYYFSDENKKNSYRSINQYDKEILKYSNNLQILESDTNNIVQYVEDNLDKNKKKYKFWELLFYNEK